MKHTTAAVAVVTALASASIAEASAAGMVWPLRFALAALLGFGIAAMIRAGLIQPLSDIIVAERRARAEAEDEIDQRRRYDRIMREIAEMLAVAHDEATVLDVSARAVDRILTDRENSLLICGADSLLAFRCDIDRDGLDAPRPVSRPRRCLALAGAGARTASSTSELGACDHRAVADLDVSTLCLGVAGPEGPIGVISSVGAEGDLPSAAALATLDRLVTLLELRLTQLGRVTTGTTRPADPPPAAVADPLTGLPNHVTAVHTLRALIERLTPFSVALCNIDRLGAYNESHGRDIGDVALRLTSQVLRDSLRPDDIVCRMDGDTFLVVFPNCPTLHASAAMERVREALVLRLAENSTPRFTCSVGLADSNQGESIEEILDAADLAMSMAKYEGGNRVRTAWLEDATEADPIGPASVD